MGMLGAKNVGWAGMEVVRTFRGKRKPFAATDSVRKPFLAVRWQLRLVVGAAARGVLLQAGRYAGAELAATSGLPLFQGCDWRKPLVTLSHSWLLPPGDVVSVVWGGL